MSNPFKKNNKQKDMNPQEKETTKDEELVDANLNETSDTETNDTETTSDVNVEPTKEEELTKQLEEANAKIEEQNNAYLRLAAEFDNYRKRTMKEKAELIKNGGERAITSILSIIDDLERAITVMETSTDVPAVQEGIKLILSKFMSTMNQNGVLPMETEGQDFNTDYHEAIASIPAPSEDLKGKILDCVQKGYILNEKVIRHAKVVVGE